MNWFKKRRKPLTIFGTTDYTDERFFADCKKHKKALDRMEKAALAEDTEGKTRLFPT